MEISSAINGPTERIAYEDVRIMQNSEITRELMTESVDTILDGEGEISASSIGKIIPPCDDESDQALQLEICKNIPKTTTMMVVP